MNPSCLGGMVHPSRRDVADMVQHVAFAGDAATIGSGVFDGAVSCGLGDDATAAVACMSSV